MKLRLMLTILTLTLAVLLTACNDNTEPVDNTDVTTTTAAITETTTTPSQITETTTDTTTSTESTTTTTAPTDVAEPQPTVFVTSPESLQFTLTLPASWDGHYAVREDEGSVTFYELSNHQDSVQGKLFTIRYMMDDPANIDFPAYRLLGQYGDIYAVALFPTDVQYSTELADAYMKMADEVAGVLDTFVYTG